MAYYHILKERRTNLKLSIQDVSNQTRLAPQYIQAIEEHNLDVFSDDLSFVRYFVHAYSDAIGVNWQAISDEVDVDVNEFAHQRDMALTMAQRRMVEQMASVQKTKKTTKKKKKSSLGWFQKHVSRTSSSLNANQTKIIKMLVLIGIIGLGVLSLVNVGLRSISNQKLATQQELREEQLSKKEQETNKLANQRKKAKEAQALVVNKISGETNAYQLSNIQSDVKTLDLSIGDRIDENANISIDGKEISFDKEGWKQGEPAVITLQIGKGYQKPVEEDETEYEDSDYDYDYDYGYTDENLYAQGEDVTYGQDEYTEQTNNY